MRHWATVLLVIAAVPPLGGTASESDLELLQRVRFHMETGGGGVMGDLNEEIAAATPEQRNRLINTIRQVVEEEFKAPQTPKDDGGIGVIGRCADALKRAGDEEATLAIFGSRLTQITSLFGFGAEESVIIALSRCRDYKAVEAMTDLAQLRQRELTQLLRQLPTPNNLNAEQNRKCGRAYQSWLLAIEGLARSANSAGKSLARELYNEFVKKLDGSTYREGILHDIATKIDPLLRDTPQTTPPRRNAPVSAPKAKPKELQPSKPETPATVTPPEPKPSSSSGTMLIAGVLAALVLLSALIWFLREK